jgi:hypothetical protein
MKTEKTRIFIRVIPQFTIRPNTVSLLAEEDKRPFIKGQLVMQVRRIDVHDMLRPFMCEILSRKGKDKQVKFMTKIITKENAPDDFIIPIPEV